jgi:Na+/proline symporter/CheY-like chemotaxis protein
MLQGWSVVLIALAYIGLLFAVAHWGDRKAKTPHRGSHPFSPTVGRPWIYALSVGVYCTSWTFFGSVGLAAHRGLDFLTIYIGPILMFTIGYGILRRVVRLAKAERITSIADFISARYGKNQRVAAVVTVIAFVGIVPYIALQLKAVSVSVSAMAAHYDMGAGLRDPAPFLADIALFVAITMAAFACLFGTRHVDATEHQDGLIFAIAIESIVKLVAFFAVGIYVVYVMFDGPNELIARAVADPLIAGMFRSDLSGGNWLVMSVLSFFAILLLPRMFHVLVVENNTGAELARARWVFPVYLLAINVFVVPIAVAGMLILGPSVDADTFVLRLPLHAGADWIGILAFIGGLSAATAMVIVASVALSIMVCNEIVVPIILRRRVARGREPADMGQVLLTTRRIAIFVILALAYIYYRLVADSAALAEIGLLAFAAVAQFAPAFFGGLLWRRATARGAIAGMVTGFLVWAYTLLLPAVVAAGMLSQDILIHGPFGIWLLRPTALLSLGFDPLTHGVFWSLVANSIAFVVASLARGPEAIERLQANIFVPSDLAPTPAFKLWRTSITVEDLRTTISRYLGDERTKAAFDDFAAARNQRLEPNQPADIHILRFAEQLLAAAIGAASSRLVLSLLVKRRDPSAKTAIRLLDDASAAIQYNRDLLQTALDQVRQGLAVFDPDMRLICWNRQFREVLDLPPALMQVGTTIDAILRYGALRGEYGAGDAETKVQERLARIVVRKETYTDRVTSTARIIDVRPSPMPDGGIVVTLTDVTERVEAAEQLERANESLERRVTERTEQLTRLNEELANAKAEADEANLGKTKFLAAAGHDILQPLNAARLYVTSLVEKTEGSVLETVAANIDASLDGVEEILGALLDISRLDTGALKPEIGPVRLDEIFKSLRVEFEPIAAEKRLNLRYVPSSVTVRTDRRLLRRLLQNLISNAIKYTPQGRVLIGCRRVGNRIRVEVIDTGIGIADAELGRVFEEFQRLDTGARIARGLGLGLSIVDRIGRVLSHPIGVTSTLGRGSRFWVELPVVPAVPLVMVAETPARIPSAPLAGLMVVAIDNDVQILDGMATLLGGWGCVLITAATTQDALARLTERGLRPDVIIADYHLDTGTGLEAIQRLRWTFATDLPALLITADRSQDVRDAALVKNVSLLNKPLKPAALRAHLAQIVAQRAAAE